jgi:hypothetical protein
MPLTPAADRRAVDWPLLLTMFVAAAAIFIVRARIAAGSTPL